MNGFKVSICEFQNKTEPNRKEKEILDSIIAKHTVLVKSDNIKSFVDQVGEKGCAFCPSTFKDGAKSRENFEQSQLLPLYFDSFNSTKKEISFEKIKAKADRYNLPILFACDVFSPILGTRKKFGVTFLNNVPLTSLKEAESVQKALMMIFPEADKSCSDVSRLYIGGNKILYFDETIPEINVDWLFMNMSLYLKNRRGETNYKRNIAEFSKATGVALNEKKLPDISVLEDLAEDIIENINDVNDKNLPNSTIDHDRSGKKLSNLRYLINFNDEDDKCCNNDRSNKEDKYEVSSDYQKKKNSSYHGYLRYEDLGTLSSICNLYHDLISGKRTLSQQELLGLATNLTHAESGKKEFKTALRSNSYYNGRKEKYDNWDFYFYYIKKRDPLSCTSFCPYHDTCPHGKDIISTARIEYHQIEKIANYGMNLVSIEEAWEDFERNFHEAVKSDERIWHVISCQTALGKTQAILELIKDTQLKVLLAVPTNKLKREVCERAEEMGIDIIVSPSLHELKDELPDEVWFDIERAYNIGKSPMPRLEKAIAEDDIRCVKLIKWYKRELDEFNNSDGHAITTHRRLTSMKLDKYDLVIIDEDIIYSTVIPNRDTVTVSELKKLKKKLPAGDLLRIKIGRILKETKRSEFFTLNKIDYDGSYAKIKMDVNIPALCSASYFCFREVSDQEDDLKEDSVSFIKPIEFQEDIKYIMLSATVNEAVCECCFGEDNVKFYHCKEAKLTGTLNQYGDKPMSRSFMTKNPDIIDKIKKWSGVKNTISFKKFNNYCTDDLHFGNCAGCDTLKNEDIDVIGTPHQPEWIYKLFAYSYGFDTDAKLKSSVTVVNNGYRFRFPTYDDMTLRNIQFYMIESELEQAVGRARLLRYDCIVNLFSNFPIKQAVMKESKYDKEK